MIYLNFSGGEVSKNVFTLLVDVFVLVKVAYLGSYTVVKETPSVA